MVSFRKYVREVKHMVFFNTAGEAMQWKKAMLGHIPHPQIINEKDGGVTLRWVTSEADYNG